MEKVKAALLNSNNYGFLIKAVVVTLLIFNKLYYPIDSEFNIVLLLLVLPFSLRRISQAKSLRYGILSLALLLLFFVSQLNTVLLFGFLFCLFFFFESTYGKLSALPVVLVAVTSPIVHFFNQVIGFEVRLGLSKFASEILSVLDANYSASGNVILHGTSEFHVDPVCLGLKMVTLGFFVTLALIAYNQQKRKVSYGFLSVVLLLLLSYGLVVVSNLIRIVVITLLQSEANTFSHEAIGLFCFVMYVALPLFYFVKKMPGKTLPDEQTDQKKKQIKYGNLILTSAIILLLAIVRFSPAEKKVVETQIPKHIEIKRSDLEQSIENNNIVKLWNDDLLIYIKPPSKFFSSEHSPLICWRGCGYKIEKEEMATIGEHQVYFCELKQGNETLYSTWWYQSETDMASDQFTWRYNNLVRGEKYHLINVISHNKSIVFSETAKLLRR